MIEKIMNELQSKYNCASVNAGVFSNVVIEGAKFKICAYDLKGVGRVSTVEMKRFIGAWDMQSVIISPFEKDMPIYYYIRHREKGKYIYRVELFDTQLEELDVSSLQTVLKKYESLQDEPQKERWYDSLKLDACTVKKVEKKNKEELNLLIWDHFKVYMDLLENSTECKAAEKKKKVKRFADELCKNSGIAVVEIFIANYGEKITEKLINEVLFGLR